MTERARERVILASLLVVAMGAFFTGLRWGLPGRSMDPFLFGDRRPWTGEQIVQLIGRRDPPSQQIGADVDANPSDAGSVLNDADPKRAEIVARYRLYTFQPDEMITMKSLGGMNPGRRDFDPRLYQYGGMWVYPVGGLIRLFTQPRSQAYYLDHPEEFGRFYLIARLYVVMWGLAGVWAVYRIARDAGGGLLGSVAAAVLFIFLPVVVSLSHEAKPHLPGAVLVLLSALCAARFVVSGKTRWWVLASVLCGMSAGAVISNVVAVVILPLMVLMRPPGWSRRVTIAACAFAIAGAVYFATNPYVLTHLLGDQTVLRSNLSNSTAMYEPGRVWEGFGNATRLVSEGTTPVLAVVGLIGVVVVFRRRAKPQAAALNILSLLAAVILVQFVLLAAGKPGEYGRFALLPDIVLAISAAVLIGGARLRTFEKVESLGLLIVLTVLPSLVYLHNLIRDSGPAPRRMFDAQVLAELHRRGARTLGVERDPAPYRLPPVDLFEWQIVLLPQPFDSTSSNAPVDVIVRPVDVLERVPATAGAYVRLTERTFADVFPARLSWANKPLEIWVRKELRLGAQ